MPVCGLASTPLESSFLGGSGGCLSTPKARVMQCSTWAFRRSTTLWYSSTPPLPLGMMLALASWRQSSRLATRFSSARDANGTTSRIKPRRATGFKTVSFGRIGGNPDRGYHSPGAPAPRQFCMFQEGCGVLLCCLRAPTHRRKVVLLPASEREKRPRKAAAPRLASNAEDHALASRLSTASNAFCSSSSRADDGGGRRLNAA